MPYSKQLWNQYDKNKTIEDNIQNDAVVTPAKMNHIEDGFSIVEQETKELVDALEKVVDSNLTATDEHIVQAAKDVDKTIQDFKQEVNEDILANEQSLVQLETETDKKFVASDNRITSIEKDVVVEATNQFINPEFKDGVVGWRLSGVTAKNVNGVIEVTTTNKNSFANQYLNQNFVHDLTHKYYISIEVKPKYSNRFGVYLAGNYFINILEPIANQWNKQSVVYSPLATANLLIITHGADTNYEIGDNYYIKNMLRVDLTETFGAGNEPTVEQMDRLLEQFPNSWFDGTQNILLARWALNELRRLDDEKANRKQEEWITPTLLSGATGNPQYRLNQNNRVELKGIVKGKDGANLFNLVQGYRPKKNIDLLAARINQQGPKTILINNTGGFFQAVPYAPETEIDLAGITFSID